MTRSMHGWIGSWKSKWLSELGFVGFLVIGAYGVTTLVDALVINAIEFFTGKPVFDNKYSNGKINTLADGTKLHESGGERIIVREDGKRKALKVRHETSEGKATEVEIHQVDGGGFTVARPGGELLARTRSNRSRIMLNDASGRQLAGLDRRVADDVARAVYEGGSISIALMGHLAGGPGILRLASAHRQIAGV
jgi:hypothetical protein